MVPTLAPSPPQGLGLQNLDKSFQIYRARLDSFLKMEVPSRRACPDRW